MANSSIAQYTKGTTLIMPSPGSIGYLGALSIDLIISSYALKRTAELDFPQLEQLLGTKIYFDDDCIHTAAELYQGESLPGYSVLQIRSQAISGYAVSFAKSVSDWIIECEFKRVILLTGLDKTRRVDSQITGSQLRYHANFKIDEELMQKAKNLDLKALEDSPSSFALPPGTGSGQFILMNLVESKVDTLVLSYFVESGDNNIASRILAETMIQLLAVDVKILKNPPSWDRLYGKKMDQESFNEIF